ncbi:MAG: fibronectin type III domain-containing protein [Anaerolineae bacterium]|nr:fibronectin type III domain-containing protein [Anaerolineae bacterium]
MYSFSGLSADTQYTLQVRAKNSQTTSAGVSVTERTLPEPPAPPAGLQASLADPNSVAVEWDPADRADSYEIQGSAGSEQPGSQAVPISSLGGWIDVGNVNSYVVSGLSPNTHYIFEVRAINPSGRSAAAAIDFQIEADQQAGQPVADLGQGGGGSQAGGSGSALSGDGAESILTATLSPPQFNCTDEQKAMIAISPQPMGLNVQCVGPVGVGDRDLIARGVVLGVDVWGWVRGFFEVCFKQAGDLAFLDAAYATRQLKYVIPYNRDGMICNQIDRAGALVLLRSKTPTEAAADCRVTTTDPLNFRASPGGQYLLTLPALTTLNVHDRRGDWLLVDYRGRQGWVSAIYTVEDCG